MNAPKILSIDDSKIIHALISRGFSPYDVELHFASDGIEGLAAAARVIPDLILLDVMMPIMDGEDCLSKLKSDTMLKNIPVIMLTAEARKENVLRAAKLGVCDYMIKPFTDQTLIERVSRVIDLREKDRSSTQVRTMADPATVLVVDKHRPIYDAVLRSLSNTPWQVKHARTCSEAGPIIRETLPDVILVSLSFPNQAALTFFQNLRSHARTQRIPVVGLSVKTAIEAQAEAKNAGFTAVVTKPIDTDELVERLARLMNIDTSSRYFDEQDQIPILRIPAGISPAGCADLAQHVGPKTSSMVDAGVDKLIIDLREVRKLEIYLIKLLLSIVSACRELDIDYRIVASQECAEQAASFEETKGFEMHTDFNLAMETFGSA